MDVPSFIFMCLFFLFILLFPFLFICSLHDLSLSSQKDLGLDCFNSKVINSTSAPVQ